MKKSVLAATLAVLLPVAALAQNVAVVNGKPVPKARVEQIIGQITKGGQPRTPEMETQVRNEVVMREIFMQEAERRGIPATADFKNQMELARQSLMIRELFADYAAKHPVTEAEAKGEYEKFKAANSGDEYRARHILVEKEEDAKSVLAQLKAGAKFEDLAKKMSKDPGSAANGGDLDWANPNSFVPEFGKAMTSLKKGETTATPVKTQFGYHIIKLEDTRVAQFPAFDDVKAQIMQRLGQQKIAEYQEELRSKAKTDFKFSN